MLGIVIKILVVLGLCGLVEHLIGVGYYAAFGVLCGLIIVCALYKRHGFMTNDENAPTGAWMLATLGSGAIAAIIWPVIPIVFVIAFLPSTIPTGAPKAGEPGVPGVEDPKQDENRHQAASDGSADKGLLGRNANDHHGRRDDQGSSDRPPGEPDA